MVAAGTGWEDVHMARRRDHELLASLGQRLREVRIARGWTQERLADAVGIRTASISRFEHGVVGFSVTTLAELADVLSVPIGALVDVERPAEPPADAAVARLLGLPPEVRARAVAIALAVAKGADVDAELSAYLSGATPERG
jgi:transcriptional regulator with XRE-family HTH domain